MDAPLKPIPICTIQGCGKKLQSRGYCSAHYAKWRKYGDALAVRQRQIHGASLLERFNAYVGERGSGCWEWTGDRDPTGYGRRNIDNVPLMAHRIASEVHFGPLTPADHICHRCDNPACVRPEHLFKGDHAMNMADKMAKKRHRYGVSRGSDHGCSKLTEADVREIRRLGLPLKQHVERYGISNSQASDIINRRSWRHLT